MKCAFCLFTYFPFGGLQRDFLRIAKECLSRGHQVDVFTMKWEGDREPGLSIHLLPSKGFQNHVRTQQFAHHLPQHVQHHDLVIGFNKMPGLDVYYAADTCYQAKAHAQRSAWYRLTSRYRYLTAAEKAVFSSEAKTDILLISPTQQAEFQEYYGTPSERFHLLPPGIAKDRIVPFNASHASHLRDTLRHDVNISPDEFLLLFIGSGFKTKGLDRVLLSIGALPAALRKKIHLYIIGKDHSALFLKQAKNQGISDRVHFLGGRHDIPQWLLAGDLLLHPAYNENTGTVLLEAMAAGLPVLTTDVCGYAHYIKDADAGYVLPSPFCQKTFNQLLMNALLSENRMQWKKNAIQFSQTADIYDMPKRAVDLLESLKGKRR